MRHKHSHKKKPKLFDIETGSHMVGGGMNDITDDMFADAEGSYNPYAPYHDNTSPLPPIPTPNPDNHHNQDDDDEGHRHGLPPQGVSWSREQSAAVAASVLAGAAAGGAAYYGFNAGRNTVAPEDLGDIELENTGVDSNFVENNGMPDEPLYGEDEYDDGLDDPIDNTGGDIEMNELGDTSIVDNPNYEAGDLTNAVEEEIADGAPEEEGFFAEAADGIKGFWDYLTGAAADAGEVAANLGEISSAAATEAGASEGLAEAAGIIASADEVGAQLKIGV